MKAAIDRRSFLRKTALSGTGLLILRTSASARSYQANERLNVALIGCGGRGTWFVDTIPKMENVVALCDVNDKKLAETFQRWEKNIERFADSPHSWEQKAAEEYRRLLEAKPKTFRDFRKMLDEMGDRVDAAVVATPDHTHAVASRRSRRGSTGSPSRAGRSSAGRSPPGPSCRRSPSTGTTARPRGHARSSTRCWAAWTTSDRRI